MKRIGGGAFLAILVILFTTALGLAVIHITNFPYYADIENLNICETSDLPLEEILLNYNAMLEYLSPFSNDKFDLPSLKYSEAGSYHFYQCKIMFNTIYFLGFVSALILIILAFQKSVTKNTLRVSGLFTILIPSILSCIFAVNFDKAFGIFHKIFFSGTTWLFNPKVDEIIRILPVRFFLHCAEFIGVLWIVGAAVQFALSFSFRNTHQKLKYRD